MSMQLFHGSPAAIDSIASDGLFGGIFAADDESAALSHGEVLHVVTPKKPLTDFALNYEISAENVNAALGSIDVESDEVREAVLSAACPGIEELADEDTDPDGSWAVQRLRGELAAALGYDAVEMQDEHGTTWLCLPGCAVRSST